MISQVKTYPKLIALVKRADTTLDVLWPFGYPALLKKEEIIRVTTQYVDQHNIKDKYFRNGLFR